MRELTLIFDAISHKELCEYLMSLDGVLDVAIENEELLKIYVKYDSNLISSKIIKMEIELFLNITNGSHLISFDKHSTIELSEYQMIIKDSCCDYCFRGIVSDLFSMDGIEAVSSEFDEDMIEFIDVEINVKYNPKKISIDEIKKMEEDFNS